MNTFRQIVFKRAYAIVKNTGRTFSEALKKSWSIYRLLRNMKKEPISFAYKKLDNTIRNAVGVLIPRTSKTNRKVFSSVSYFDVEKQNYRSFRAENLISAAI